MDKQTIAARIKALLAKTTENGATEAEAMAAAAKARELMDRYQIELGSVGLQAEGVVKGFTKHSAHKTLGIKWRLAHYVRLYCDVKCWRSGDRIVFFGLQSDADFATWLIESLEAFVIRNATEYMAKIKPEQLPTGVKMPRWEAEKAFILGCVDRINRRLNELWLARKTEKVAGTGKSLVVVKGALVEQAFKELGVRLRGSRGSSTSIRDGGAFRAGQAAGDRASFGRPVNGGAGTRLLGAC